MKRIPRQRAFNFRMNTTAGLLAAAGVLAGQTIGSGTFGGKSAFAQAETGGKAASAGKSGNFRASQPVPGPVREFNLPKVETFKLPNGIDGYLIRKTKLPTVVLSLQFDGGRAHDTDARKALTGLCMDLMDEGTKGKDKVAFEEAQGEMGIAISTAAGDETKSATLRTLSGDIDPAIALFAEMLQSPGFRPDDLSRLQQAAVEGIKQSRASAENVAGRIEATVVNGELHPFGRVIQETDVNAVKAEWCQEMHRAAIKPQGARLFAVGDVTKEQITQLFAKHLGEWKGASPALAELPKPAPMPGKVFFANVPGSVQSVIYFQDLAPPRTSPDYLPLTVMSRVLGGGFASRINMNLRENKGYAYGAYGFLEFTRKFGYFKAGSSVRADATLQSVKELNKEIAAMHDGQASVTEAEMKREVDSLILGLPARFATSSQSINVYMDLVNFGLPLDYYNHFVADVQKLTLEKVRAISKSFLNPADMKILVVGDASTPMIQRKGGKDSKDQPLLKDGKPVNLLDGLRDMVKNKDDLVILDADGRRLADKS